jgi:hypothetical protein
MGPVNWIKTHKLTSLLLVIVAYFLWTNLLPRFNGYSMMSSSSLTPAVDYSAETAVGAPAMGGVVPIMGKVANSIMPIREPAPVSQTNRLVISNSYLSLLVENVVKVKDEILSYVQSNGGYMVNTNVSNPADAPTASVTVRVPSEKLNETLTYFRSLSLKVVSENLDGTDVTDQYVDIDAQIANLQQAKNKYQEILNKATEITDISNLTQQIISLQSQIDSYKGQQKSLAQNASLSKVTLYLSTDEIALPYAPSEMWRPNVIFKLAVRSLISHLRDLGTLAIWLAVYAVIWIPVLILLWLGWKFLNRKNPTK